MALTLLFLTPQLPFPPRQGTAIRNWGLIGHLAQRHAVHLASFREPGQVPAPELERACQTLLALPAPTRSRASRLGSLVRGQADLARRLWQPEFAAALGRLVREVRPDVILLEGLEMAPFLPALAGAAPGTPVVYDAHNAEHVIQARALRADLGRPRRWPIALYSWLQARRLRQLEAAVCRAAAAVTCVSAEDAGALRRLAPERQPVVVPNGINLSDFTDGGWPSPPEMPPGAEYVVFTGKMDYRPNWDAVLWMAEAIWPEVRNARPAARFVIVGQKPPPRVVALNGREGIVVTGEVPDTRPYIAHANVYVAPLRMGGGTRLKLLEAMAMGRPVVSTPVGAEGFALRPGENVQIASRRGDFAQAVVALLADPPAAGRLGQAGRDFVRAGYDWANIAPVLETVCLHLARQ